METIYQISLNIAILIGVFLIFRKIYVYLQNEANKDFTFLEVERKYNTDLSLYKEFGLPKFIFLYSYELQKALKDEDTVSDVDQKEIDTVELINEIKSYIPSPQLPYFFHRKKMKVTQKKSVQLIINELKDAMKIKFPTENQVAIVIVNDQILYMIHEPENVFVGASDSLSNFLKS